MEKIFHSHANKTHFRKKGRALGLILKVRVFETRRCPSIIEGLYEPENFGIIYHKIYHSLPPKKVPKLDGQGQRKLSSFFKAKSNKK